MPIFIGQYIFEMHPLQFYIDTSLLQYFNISEQHALIPTRLGFGNMAIIAWGELIFEITMRN
jgi:hypothetical protein